jgi:predicted transcriptional regulator
MISAKEQMIHIIHNQPEDSSYDEIFKELAFHRMIEKGLSDSENGRTISNEEMGRRIRKWSN